MDEKIKSWLFDILRAIEEIESFLIDKPWSFHDYQQDVRTKRAIERNIEIIGEAINRIVKLDPTIAIENSRNIRLTGHDSRMWYAF
jgi:uncharacterized protein with HEPN domain